MGNMTPEEIKYLLTVAAGLGAGGGAIVGAAIGAGIAFLLCRHFLSGYLAAKGKNLADKEDIAALTRLVEDVKLQTSLTVEQFKAKHQLRMAAVDRRLQAHQEAFALWRKLVANAYDEKNIGSVVMECQSWWEQNCLYLEPEVRRALSDSYIFAAGHKKLVESGSYVPRGDALIASIQESWKRVIDAGNVILAAMELPPLAEQEMKPFKPEGSAP